MTDVCPSPATVRLFVLAALCAVLALSASVPDVRGSEVGSSCPVFAYYYIWYDQASWSRAKSDYPLLGRYSSDQIEVMRRHIRMAQAAGIKGFIVSWKSTPTLNRRLRKLVRAADERNFKLGIMYQGLDFERDPLPVELVRHDLEYFTTHFASDRAFDIFGKPLVVWSGTWKFASTDVADVTSSLRRHVLILASEHNVRGYRRLAGLVDGDAYYWSSVNPDTYPDYQGKLDSLSAEVHSRGGLWIAPAAPGFDARAIGGHVVVDRRDGATLLREVRAARASSADAIGLISWNEFSENSYVEPSRKYGSRYIRVLASVDGAPIPNVADLDPSPSPASGAGYVLSRVTSAVVGLGMILLLLIRRRTGRWPWNGAIELMGRRVAGGRKGGES